MRKYGRVAICKDVHVFVFPCLIYIHAERETQRRKESKNTVYKNQCACMHAVIHFTKGKWKNVRV